MLGFGEKGNVGRGPSCATSQFLYCFATTASLNSLILLTVIDLIALVTSLRANLSIFSCLFLHRSDMHFIADPDTDRTPNCPAI